MTQTPKIVTGSKQVALVDQAGQEIGSADVFAAHRYPPQLHGASSVWLWRKNDRTNRSTLEILFQQRSQFKPVGATWWGNTVCGNVKPGETYLNCAHRRLEVELGIASKTVSLLPLYTFTYKTYGNETYGEYEFDQMYAATFTTESLKNTHLYQPNPDEVMNIAWLPLLELVAWAGALNFPTSTQTCAMSWDELAHTTSAQNFRYKNKNYLIAPWIVLMLKDERLARYFASLT